MNRFVSIDNVQDIHLVADDLRSLLLRDDNADISLEFPNLVENYTRDTNSVIQELEAARERYSVGMHEKFIIFAGERAVGLSIITHSARRPRSIQQGVPNLSGFIANPYRGIGLGRASLEARIKIVDERFGQRAWTSVRHANYISKNLVESVGFQLDSMSDSESIYAYRSKKGC